MPIKPRYDSSIPGALVMPRPSQSHQVIIKLISFCIIQKLLGENLNFTKRVVEICSFTVKNRIPVFPPNKVQNISDHIYSLRKKWAEPIVLIFLTEKIKY